MADPIDFSDLQLIGGAHVQNMWALLDGNMLLLARGRGVKITTGEAVVIRQLVRLNPTTAKADLAVNDDRPFLGLMTEDADAEVEAIVQTEGLVVDDQPTLTWDWTPGQPVYAHATTPGALTQTATPGAFQPPVALALTPTALLLLPPGFQAATQAPVTEILEGSPTPEVLTFGNIEDGQHLKREGSAIIGDTLDLSDPPATQILEGSPTPAVLDIGPIADGQFLKREADQVVGTASAGGTEEWQDYTPAWTSTGTPPSVGNGSITGRYFKQGKYVVAQIRLVWGSTTSAGTLQWRFSVPIDAAAAWRIMGTAVAIDTGSQYYHGHVLPVSVSSFALQRDATGGIFSPAVPHAWTNTDELMITVIYESAS
jgi:hypothetical protein